MWMVYGALPTPQEYVLKRMIEKRVVDADLVSDPRE